MSKSTISSPTADILQWPALIGKGFNMQFAKTKHGAFANMKYARKVEQLQQIAQPRLTSQPTTDRAQLQIVALAG